LVSRESRVSRVTKVKSVSRVAWRTCGIGASIAASPEIKVYRVNVASRVIWDQLDLLDLPAPRANAVTLAMLDNLDSMELMALRASRVTKDHEVLRA